MEYERRAVVVASFRVGKKPAEVMAWTDEFVTAVKKTVENDGSQSYAKITADMGCHKSTICRTIKKDIDYSSYRKSHCMLITNASKESRKVKAVALLNELEHGSAGMLRFFSHEKNFIQDKTSNRQNGRWMFPSIMVLGIISRPESTAEIYQEVPRRVVKPSIDEIVAGRPYVFQQDSAPAHKAKTTQAWLLNNVLHHWSPDLWTPDFNLLD
ncbi:unnamed protein product [Acanthosepion pharaonis]|uniref:Transposase n=1 Tax=Acanthosepion pharaonis TaxID=158019 RepID=A0A812E155_ACAPH|nr:unnamed protein product [Sepia pharaonis]